MDIQLSFPGGKRVDAQVGKFTVQSDQPAELGGADSAITPYDMFLASIATCAGIFALGFCQARNLSTEGLAIVQHHELNATTHLVERIRIEVKLPADFPERYRAAILRAVEGCKVKKTIAAPPTFEVALAGEAAK